MASHFGNTLKNVLKTLHISQSALAPKVPMHVDSLRKITSGGRTTKETVGAIIDALPQGTHAALNQAWLRDCIPDKHEHDVIIRQATYDNLEYLASEQPGADQARERIRVQLDPKTRRAILGLAVKARHSRAIRKMLITTHAALEESA